LLQRVIICSSRDQPVQGYLPEAEIHIFDNNSKDKTAEIAKEHGVHVQLVPLKGNKNS